MDEVKAVQNVVPRIFEEIVEKSKFILQFSDFNKNIMKPKEIFVSEKVKLLFIDAEWWITIQPIDSNCFHFKVHISRSAGQVELENYKFNFQNVVTGFNDFTSEWSSIANNKIKHESKNTHYTRDKLSDIFSFDVVLTIKRFHDPPIKSKFSNPVKGYYNIVDNISKLKDDSTFADFKFIVKGRIFEIHKCVLAASSSVFAGLFTSDMQEARENVCIVDNFEPETFDHVLQFIYRAKLPSNFSEIAQDIYEAADYFDLELLKDVCANEIHSQLSKDNAVELYCWAYVFDSLEELKKDSWDMIKRDILHIYFHMKDEPWPPEDLMTLIELKHRYQQSMENIKEDSEPKVKK